MSIKTAGRYQISGFTFGILLPQFLQWKETWYQCKEKCFIMTTYIIMMMYMHLLMTSTSKNL